MLWLCDSFLGKIWLLFYEPVGQECSVFRKPSNKIDIRWALTWFQAPHWQRSGVHFRKAHRHTSILQPSLEFFFRFSVSHSCLSRESSFIFWLFFFLCSSNASQYTISSLKRHCTPTFHVCVRSLLIKDVQRARVGVVVHTSVCYTWRKKKQTGKRLIIYQNK